MQPESHAAEVTAWAADSAWEPMITPVALRELVPLTDELAAVVGDARRSVCQVLDGADDRLLVIAGPCSIHDRKAALEYAELLAPTAARLSDDLIIVMRTYVEKSRSGPAWTGLAMAPDLGGPPDPVRGYALARSIMAEIVRLGVPVAAEWVTLAAPAYLGDLSAWGCIGARNVEGQAHRQMASGLAMPVGMKNRTDGSVQAAVDAVRVAEREQAILGLALDGTTAVARTPGNPYCHVVLRGGTSGPNHHPAAIGEARRLLRSVALPERLVVDANHGNSGKSHERQEAVAHDLARQVGKGNGVIRGVMLESFLLPGRQQAAPGRPLVHGQSVTDACMSWPTTASVLTHLARAAAGRRRRRAANGQVNGRTRTETVPVTGSPAARAVALVETGLFDTYVVYERAGVWTVAGGAVGSVTLDATQVRRSWSTGERSRPWRSRPLAAIGGALADLPMPHWTAYGWIAFEAAHPSGGSPAGGADLAHLIVPRVEVRISAGTALITSADGALRHAVRQALSAEPPAHTYAEVAVDLGAGRDWYARAVTDAVREIHSGAFQKVILSRSVPLTSGIDIPRTYLRGRAANTPARSFLLRAGGITAAGFCPETILEAGTDRIVSTQPLAGTRSRSRDAAENLRLRQELLTDPKELVEHALSVRWACEELREVCLPDSVVVNDLLSVKERGSVQHLASRVSGRLAGDRTAWDALEAVFPGVTASGIPKSAACDHIARTESGPRGLYAGAVLVAGSDGTLDAGLVLRAVFEQDGRQWLRAGAGIIAQSRPEREYEETCEKLGSIAPYLVPVSESAAEEQSR